MSLAIAFLESITRLQGIDAPYTKKTLRNTHEEAMLEEDTKAFLIASLELRKLKKEE